MAFPDLSIPLRQALVGDSNVTTNLPQYQGLDYNVFTRTPAPPDALYPMILVSPDLSTVDRGGLTDNYFCSMVQVTVWGQNDTADKYRIVDQMGDAVFDLFHRNKQAITVMDWNVTQIWCEGPKPAPSEDDAYIGRIVTLRVELSAAI